MREGHRHLILASALLTLAGAGAAALTARQTTPDTPPRQRPWGTVHFPTRTTTVNARQFAQLDALVERLNEDPSLTVRLTGHAYDDFQRARNMSIAKRRAEAVATYLIDRGIAADRIRTDSRGDADPRIPEDSFAERKRSNRVEIYLQ